MMSFNIADNKLQSINGDDSLQIAVNFEMFKGISSGIEVASLYHEAFENLKMGLSNLKTSRGGGVQQNSGFVFEYMYSYENNLKSIKNGERSIFNVLDNNKAPDIMKIDANGNISYIQAKKGYEGNNKYKIDTSKYSNMDFAIEKGNTNKDFYKKKGINIKESSYSKEQIERFTKIRIKENKVLNKLGLEVDNAPITSRLYAMSKEIQVAHTAAINSGLSTVALSSGLSLGNDLYFLIQGDKELKEVAIKAVKESVISGATAYTSTFITTMAAPAITSALGNVVIFETAKNIIVQIGAITAQVAIGAGPMFLIGLGLGCACAAIKVTKMIKDINNKYYEVINDFLDKLYITLESLNKQLANMVDSKLTNEINIINREFKNMQSALVRCDLDLLNSSICNIANLFDRNNLFYTQDEFDDFFFSDDEYIL